MSKFLATCFLFVAGLGAQPRQEPPFRLPDSAQRLENLVYAQYGARELRLDLYLPKDGRGPFPAVVYIHGGGWSGGSKNAFSRQAAHMATKGFVGACIEYRLSGEAPFPAAVYDSKAAVRWLRANAAKYRIDPGRIGAAGGSAGGHLVAMLGTSSHVTDLEGDGGNAAMSSRVQAVAAFNPAVDLVGFGKGAPGNGQNAVTRFLGGSYAEKPDAWAKATPLTHVSARSAPLLALHGTSDGTVPYSHSVQLVEELKASGVRAELFTAEGAGHGFFNRPPWFEPTLERMEKFFMEALRK
ncbi:MAG: alpha/beta hydrolase fold domain-containing protein [Bryobacteraceae bacterium]